MKKGNILLITLLTASLFIDLFPQLWFDCYVRFEYNYLIEEPVYSSIRIICLNKQVLLKKLI